MENNKSKTKSFLRKYGFYILAGCLAVAITLTLTLGVKKQPETPLDNQVYQEVNDPVVDVEAPAITFALPLENAVILKGFSATELMFNQTLKQWESHKALDLVSESSKNVIACLEGTVKNVETNYANGTVITIEHAGGFVSKYSSVAECQVKAGDVVEKGQVLGVVSTTSANEAGQGEHLHFALQKDGKIVDPTAYLEFGDK